ncbi:MAG: endolytic transglycosylase MltG [Sphingomonadaceae bacterium]
MPDVRWVLRLSAVLAGLVIVATVVAVGWNLVRDPEPLLNELLSRLDEPAVSGDTSARVFVVQNGETASTIGERLQSEGLIRDARVFRYMADLRGVAGDLAAGEYELSAGMKPSEILARIAAGETRPTPLVTVPEGWRAEEIAERMAARGIGSAEQFMAVVRQGKSTSPALAGLPPGASLEGYLFPETYAIDNKTTPESMVARMVEQFESQFTPEMREKADRLGMTIHQIVILASVIEREAVIPSERPLMAGVFFNRLREGMPLQSDPTVQYALATADPQSRAEHGWWKRELTVQDLEIDSPYNTYRYPGLPAGPICNPGLASLRAAVEPESTDFLYFVAKPDGSHAFAATLDEHNANVATYSR